MLIVAATSPVMGAIADYAGVRKRLLVLYRLICITGTCLLATVKPGMALWGFALSMVTTIGLEGAMVFYNAYLPELAPPEKQGRVSGWGFGVGYAGSLLGLLVAMPLVGKELFGLTFIVTGIGFLLFALPPFFQLPPDKPARLSIIEAGVGGLRETWRTFLEILRVPKLRRFLAAYFLYIDGVNTAIYFSSIFAATTLGFPMQKLIVLYAVVQVSALAGAMLWAKPTDRLGPKTVVIVTLAQWTLVVTAVYFVETHAQFFVVAAIAGSGMGAIQAASRSFMARLIPAGREAEFFGFYAFCGKASAILGPLVFGMVSAATGGNQRLALLSVLAFFVAGFLLLYPLKAGEALGSLEKTK
jgi:UMF1 family MFS transporter